MKRILHLLLYLRVSHPEKRRFDILYPLLFSLPVALSLSLAPAGIRLSGDAGLVSQVNQLLALLSGFFIASLAAVATFGNEAMDVPMPGRPLVLRSGAGNADPKQLTRRQFLCLLFGYLSLLSVCLFVLGVIALALAPSASLVVPPSGVPYYRTVFVFFYTFVLSHLIINTFLGLYYLAIKVHEPHKELKIGGPRSNP